MIGAANGSTDAVEISGGSFNVELPEDYLAEGTEIKKNEDGTYGVKAASVAKIGTVEYASLAEAIAALNSTNHTLTLIDASAWDAATPVYWQAGTQSGYAAKLTDALTAAYKANAGDITIVCRPGADVGAMTHGHVADNLTVYGNNAYISGGECDLEVDTYMYSRETGKQVATGGVYLDKAITITAYELDNLGVWGQRHTDFTINISLNDCDGKAIEGKANVQRVYISGTTGVNNITVVGCDFLTKATALYSNADGETIIDNCSFARSQVPVNFNHKANGTQTVTVKNSTFTNCGDNGDWKQFAAPVRFVNSGSGTLTATVDNCTFAGTVGANGDILLGDGRNGEDSFNVSVTVVNTAADVQIHQPGYYGADGSTTDANCEKTTVAKSDTPTTFFTVAVAEVTFTDGTTKKYSDIAEALEAARSATVREGQVLTVKLLSNVVVPAGTVVSRTIDLNGYTLTTDDLNLNFSNGKDLIVTDSSDDKNGKLVITGSANMNIAHKIILNAGTIETSRAINQDYGVNNTIEINGGTLILKNGATLTNSTGRTVTINGGTIITDAGKSIFKAGSSTLDVKIKGGDFTQVGKLTESTSNIKFSISGGTFSADVPEEYCAKDYYPAHFNDGTKGVKKETVSTEEELRRALYEAALDGSLTRIKLTGNIKLEMLYAAENFGTEKLNDNAIGDTFNRYKLGVHPTAEKPDQWNPLVINQTQKERVVYGAYYHVSATDERIARLVIKAGQNVVIDLNGYTIEKNARATHGDWSETCTDIIGNYGTLEIKDSAETKGTIKGNGYISCNGAVLHNYEGGGMTVGAVNVDGNAAGMTAGTGQYVIANDGGKTIINGTNVYDTATSASLVVNTAGEITITGNATLNHPATKTINVKGGDVIIESATIISDKYSIYAAKGKTTITGEITVNGTGKMAVKGGEIVKTANATVGGVPEGYAWFDNADGTQSLSKAYAKIGETYYKSLAEAIAAANADETVTLLADINTPEKTYEITKSLTIDLNGKTVTGSGYDGVFEVTGKNINVVLNATNGGKVIAVENSGSAGKYAMAVWMCGDGSTLTINGGEFIQNITSTNDKQMDMIYASAGTIIINSGSFTSGTPKWTLNIKDSAYKNRTANIIVNGGTFTDYDPRNAENEGKGTSLVADGVGIDKNADGTFTAKSGMAAQIVDADGNSVAAYATLADAIAAADAGETLTLLTNIDVTNTLKITNNVIINLNGKTVTNVSGSNTFDVTGTLKIIGEGIVDLQANGIRVPGGNLEIAGGTFKYNNIGGAAVIMYGNANFKMTGGKLEIAAGAAVNAGYYGTQDIDISGGTIVCSHGSNPVFGVSFSPDVTLKVSGDANIKVGAPDKFVSGNFTKIAVSGGNFDAKIDDKYLAKGFELKDNADGTYGVQKATKGSEKNPYNLEELGAMTRAEYIEAQEALGGTMYVEIGNYSYDKDGVLGNGVRNDTPGQMPDHSKLNAYAENGYLGAKNDGANGKNIIFVGGSITSGVTGYTSIDNIGTSLLLAVPAYTNVTFEGVTFKNVISFDYQLYTSPWSQLGELKFNNCEFNGLIVGAIAAQTLTFNGCEFTNYTNTISANNSNPTWIRPAYGNWTQGDNEGQGSDFSSLTTINFTGNKVTSTRPVKFERIAQWEMETKVTVTGNKFDIKSDGSSKNVGLYFGANAKFDLVVDNNEKTDGTSALYTAVYKAPNGTDYAGLPAGSTVKDSNGADVEVAGVIWKTTDALTLKTTTEAVEVAGVKFATLEEAFAAAKNGDTITLLEDCKSDRINLEDKSVTVVLNGKTLTSTAAYGVMFCAKNGNKITIDGTVEGSKLVGTLMITSGTDGHIEVNGGTYESNQYCPIYVNGSVSSENSTVTVKNAIIQAINSNSDQDSGCAVYLAGYSTSVFENCTITAPITGIEIRAGKLTLNNCDVTGGNGEVTKDANGNGTTVTNAALAISQHTTKKPIEVIINGGTFNGKAAVYQTDVQGTGSADVKIAVNDGTFNGTISGETDGTITISGGKFKFKVDDKYFANGHVCSGTPGADGYYTIADHPIESFGVTIGEGLSLRLYVRDEYRNGKLLVKYTTVGSNPEVEYEAKISSVIEKVDGVATIRYCARIFGITPQMADVIIKVQYVDENDVAIGSEKEVSILKYCHNYVKEDSPEAVKTFVSKMLEYCASAMDYRMVTNEDQIYLGYTWKQRADALRAEKVDICGEDKVKYEFDLDNLGTYTNIGTTFKTRGMVYDNIIRIYFAIPSEEFNPDYKYYMSGNEIHPTYNKAKDQWEFSFTIAPYEYCNSIRITIKDGEDEIGEYACSLAIILESFSRKSGDAETDALAKLSVAAYEYCRSLADYPTSKDFNQ